MIKLLVVADDYTGALDTGVQFAKRGARTLVTRDTGPEFFMISEDVEVLCVDTETRHRSGTEAYGIVRGLVDKAAGYGVRHFYKKTDSALRGNIGGELQAAMDGAGCDRLMFIPAYPRQRRTTENGSQYIDGVPLARSRFAADSFEPVFDSFIPDIVARQTDTPATRVRTGEVPDLAHRRGIFIFNGKTDEDLARTGAALKESGELRLTAGCAGFADVLSRLIEFRIRPTAPVGLGGDILLVSGSVNSAALEQMRYAKDLGFKGACLSPAQKLDRHYPDSAECSAFVREISALLRSRKSAYIEAIESAADMDLCSRFAAERHIEADPSRIAENVGRIVKKIIDGGEVSNLFVIGGDTLAGILDGLRITGVMPVDELYPGVALSRVADGCYSFSLITKAGGLGPADVVAAVAARLKESR